MQTVLTQAAQEPATQAPSEATQWMRSELPAWLQETTFLLENWQWLALLLTALAGVVVERVLGYAVRSVILATLRRRHVTLDDRTVNHGVRPFRIVAMGATWWVVLHLLDFHPTAEAVLTALAKLVAIGGTVWGAYRLVDVAMAALAVRASRTASRLDDLLVPLVGKSLKIFIAAFGSVFLAANFDVNVGSLLAGLGLGGLAFALAAQTTVKNLFGSVTVLVDRPFQIGDVVVIGGIEGTVEEFGFRSTRIRTPQDSLVTIANSELLDAKVENLGARRHRRWRNLLLLQPTTASSRVDAFCAGICELVKLHPDSLPQGSSVGLAGFAKEGLEVQVVVNFRVADAEAEARARHKLGTWVLQLAEELGIDFASPTLRTEPRNLAATAGTDDAVAIARRIAGIA